MLRMKLRDCWRASLSLNVAKSTFYFGFHWFFEFTSEELNFIFTILSSFANEKFLENFRMDFNWLTGNVGFDDVEFMSLTLIALKWVWSSINSFNVNKLSSKVQATSIDIFVDLQFFSTWSWKCRDFRALRVSFRHIHRVSESLSHRVYSRICLLSCQQEVNEQNYQDGQETSRQRVGGVREARYRIGDRVQEACNQCFLHWRQGWVRTKVGCIIKQDSNPL